MRIHLTLRSANRSMLILLMACGQPNGPKNEASSSGGAEDLSTEISRYESALQQAPIDASESHLLCQKIDGKALREDCVLAIAPALAKENLEASVAACEQLDSRSECYFRLAEALGDSHLCEKAGDFELDCRMHLFSFALNDWLAEDADVESILSEAPEHIEKAGLLVKDFRPWTALWRWRLGAAKEIDRSLCRSIPESWNRETCLESGLVLFGDRLNHFRDKGQDLCEGELPPPLKHAGDADLERLFKERKSGDLCDPAARQAPPPDRVPGSQE